MAGKKEPTKALVRFWNLVSRLSKRIHQHSSHSKSHQNPVPEIKISCCISQEEPVAPKVPECITVPSYLDLKDNGHHDLPIPSPTSPRAASYPPTPDYIKNSNGLWSSGNAFFSEKCIDEKLFGNCDLLRDDESPEPRDWVIAYDDLEMGHKVLSNGDGDIYKGRWHGNVLVYKHSNASLTTEEFISEAEKLSKIRHENVLLFLGAVVEEDPQNFLIVIQPPNNQQSLHQLLTNPRRLNKLPANLKWSVAYQLAQAISYLHSKDFCVGKALHSGNVFLDSKVKLSLVDFGAETELFPKRSNRRQRAQLAPELRCSENASAEYTSHSDAYSFGSLLFELFTERKPFQSADKESVDRPDIPSVIQKIIGQCWNEEPELRPSFPEILDAIQKKCCFFSRYSSSQPDKLNLIGSSRAF